MKFNKIVVLIFTLFLSFNLQAHEGGHGHPSRVWTINEVPTTAEFVKYEKEQVYLMDKKHVLSSYDLSSFSTEEQEWILKNKLKVNAINGYSTASNKMNTLSSLDGFLYLIGGLVVFFALFKYVTEKRNLHLAFSALGFVLIAFTACKKDDVFEEEHMGDITTIPANDISFLTSFFGQFDGVNTSYDDEWFYISSNGLPTHDMMKGITNWQQQVPIDQDYKGANSWAIPLQPELSDSPLSTQTNLLKGAIAIAANGIPIFNPLNNRGEDANAIGELDQWGGHCGRADDYHYHLPPTHLQSIVGADNPIAYAVDGFPVYGETTEELDENLGRFNADNSYQYHTIKEYPYFIAAMKGEVTLDPSSAAPENQVIPQAMTQELRPATDPLQGAEITDFIAHSESSYTLTYELNQETYIINYSWDANRLYTYEFINPDGTSKTETYYR